MTWTHEHSWKLAASPASVFTALTDATALSRWFAEHVKVGGAVGEPYAFWGRHTLETPEEREATQRITNFVPERALSYSWQIGSVPTEVVIALSAEGDACRLLLHHTVHGTLPYPRERALVDDHWRYAFGNLAAHLAGGTGIVLPDFSDRAPVVRQEILIDAPREVVFRSLVTPELVNQWLGSKGAIIEPREGGRFELGWSYKVDERDVTGGPTRILEYVENERLTLDWPDWRGDPEVPVQRISFALESVGAQTRVTFVHSGFTRTTDMSDYPFGWVWFLSQLQAVAAKQANASSESGG